VADINSRRSITAIVYLAVVGPCVFILQPGFVQGLVAYLGFDEQQAGLIASYEMFGLAATTLLLSFVSRVVDWRKFLVACLILCVVGNLASLGQTDFTTLSLIRFATGLGSGGLVSLTFTMAGLTTHPDRSFGLIVVWVLTYGAFGMLLMPSAYEAIGMNGLFVFFALFCASGLFFVTPLPHSSDIVDAAEQRADYSELLKIVSLSGVLIYNTAVGIVWAYLFLIGLEAGMDEQSVANALTVSQFLGIGGAFLPVLLGVSYGRLLPLGISMLGGAVFIYLLVGEIGALLFWTGVCGFNFLWNVATPYLLASLADFDSRGRVVVHGVSMQFLGFAIGPLLASRLLTAGGYDLVNTSAVVLFVIATILFLPGSLAQRHHL